VSVLRRQETEAREAESGEVRVKKRGGESEEKRWLRREFSQSSGYSLPAFSERTRERGKR
jgi:hypothetical protein